MLALIHTKVGQFIAANIDIAKQCFNLSCSFPEFIAHKEKEYEFGVPYIQVRECGIVVGHIIGVKTIETPQEIDLTFN